MYDKVSSTKSRIMKVLNKQELKKAEEALRLHFPQSLQVYGYVFLLNRLELEPIDVLVDRWPDFRVLLVKQKTDFIGDVCVFTEDESCLRNVLIRTDVLDWKRNFNLSVNLQHKEVIQAVAMNKGVAVAEACVWHLMELQDPSKLPAERLSVQVSSVSESHAPLINSTWKFNKGELTVPLIKNMIRNFPSCCVLDSEGRPVSWILTYASCAMGMLYTLPEHRQKGYAKALVSILAKKLHSEGYPVYCFVREENQPSYRLLTKLSFQVSSLKESHASLVNNEWKFGKDELTFQGSGFFPKVHNPFPKVLSKEELKKAEEKLRNHFPQSLQAYGYVYMMNRVKADPIDVLVDRWPDFNVLFVRPLRQEKADFFKDICIHTKDERSLGSLLISTDVWDWKQYLCLSANLCHVELLNSIAVNRGVTNIQTFACHLMTLQDPSHLPTERSPLQVSSVNESHLDLVNSTWTFGDGEFSKRFIRDMIRNFPSCCLLDSEGRPVSWILTYASCAIGMLYTLPEHRQKGYAKALVSILAKKLHSEGYPVYCFVLEDNQTSFRLFTSLGFTVDPSYRAAWLICDPDCKDQ